MTRSQKMSLTVFLLGAPCVWMSLLRADDKSSSVAGDDPVKQLLARIEKLERRVETLEQSRQAVRQIDAQFVPAAGWFSGRPEDWNTPLPHGALIVPPKAARPAGTVFLPRQIELKPE